MITRNRVLEIVKNQVIESKGYLPVEIDELDERGQKKTISLADWMQARTDKEIAKAHMRDELGLESLDMQELFSTLDEELGGKFAEAQDLDAKTPDTGQSPQELVTINDFCSFLDRHGLLQK